MNEVKNNKIPVNDYDEIKKVFAKFVKAWETARVDEVDNCVTVDTYANFSIFGECCSRELLKYNLGIRSRKNTYSRFDTLNYVCLIEGDRAQQAAGVAGIMSDSSGTEYEHYCFNGMFANSWIKTADGWRMNSVRFDLLVDDANILGRDETGSFVLNPGPGTLSFVENWLPINDKNGWFNGVRLPVICAEYDLPWNVIKHRDNIGTDEEQIEELFYKYCYSIDTDSFGMFKDVWTDDVVAYLPPLGIMDNRTITNTLKINKSGSRRCLHLARVKSIDVHGDTADIVMCHMASAMIDPPYKFSKETEKLDIISSRWNVKARKVDGQWRFCKFFYCYGAFVNNENKAEK
jgi:hypothetical protein